MRDVILTTDLYHQHADPNDHWNLATMFSLAHQGLIRFAGIMCDDDRALKEDGSYLHFGDPSVQSVAQMNYITGLCVPVGFGSRKPIKNEDDIKEALSGRKISSVTLLLDALQSSKDKVDIHMCGSCKDVLLAYRHSPDLFKEKCNCIYLNAGTYEKQEPIEYNVGLEPYAYSQIFKIPCKIRWSPCFDELRPWPYKTSKRASFYNLNQNEIAPHLNTALLKYFSYMHGKVFDINWLTYLKNPLDTALVEWWSNADREMWSTPGFLASANKSISLDGRIIDEGSPEPHLFRFTPVRVDVTPDGKISWTEAKESNVEMFENYDPIIYENAMPKAIINILTKLPNIE
ncbi:MAG: hypothetical protein IJ445_00225 [Clostridia bacterium]|nr:hypothetical protein [Clostridia bacterium]